MIWISLGHIGVEEHILWMQIKSIYVFIIIYKDNVTYFVTVLHQREHVYGDGTERSLENQPSKSRVAVLFEYISTRKMYVNIHTYAYMCNV